MRFGEPCIYLYVFVGKIPWRLAFPQKVPAIYVVITGAHEEMERLTMHSIADSLS